MNLQLDAVTKQVGGDTHLFAMSLRFAPGLTVLLGPTQAGKTSLMRLLAGLERPTTGRILEDGQEITKTPVQQRSVAFVYQQFINYPSLTVFENIASPLRVQGKLRNTEIKRRVQETAALMRIDHLLDRLPAALSGGQQQRTAIARALVKESDLLLLDEPLVNLDYKLREELRAEMQNIFARRNAIVIYSTTEPQEALLLGGTTVVLDQGRLLQSGPTLTVYHQPAVQRVSEVFSDPPMNLLPVVLNGEQVILSNSVRFGLPAHMAALPRGDYQMGIRANHLHLHPQSAAAVAIPAGVQLAEISGSETFIHADHRDANGRDLRLIAQLSGVHSFAYGAQTTLYLDPNRLYAFDRAGQLAAAPQRTSVQAQPEGGV